MEKWIRERLSNCLDFEIPDEMIGYILTIKTAKEFDDYFESLLDQSIEDHRVFLADCKKRLLSVPLPNKKTQSNQNPNQTKKGNQGSAQIKQNISKNAPVKQSTQDLSVITQQGAKKKTKFVNLYENDGSVAGNVIMLKGRRHCDCQASQHKLINNCLNCGRIVCEQEGSGPCLFCGEIVCTNEEMQVLKGSSKKKDSLLKSLKEKSGSESLNKALEQRDRLLEYDRNSEKRTTVIDDELDYFQENSVWLSDAEREKFEGLKQKIHDKKHGSRAKRSIKVDFAGREVEDVTTISEECERNILKEIASVNSGNVNKWSNSAIKITSDTCNVDPNVETRPLFRSAGDENVDISHKDLYRLYNRVQDKELLEMQDMRQCLSMHQPYASLLVAGIKKHEGRVWYTEHRGRLWIASTVKEPRTDEIEELQTFYKNYYNDSTIKFPEHYPNGCLLGCVKVDDCLPQEEYRELYPNGESESPFVLICSNPQELPVVFPIKGQHKIYQIDPKIHNAACKTLLRLQNPKG